MDIQTVTEKRNNTFKETIFNIAAYNCSRNFAIGRHNSKRAELSMLALVEYMHNVGSKSKG